MEYTANAKMMLGYMEDDDDDDEILDYDGNLDLSTDNEDEDEAESMLEYPQQYPETPEEKISWQEQIRMIHLRSHLNQLMEKVRHAQYITDKTREELKKCRGQIQHFEGERDRLFVEIQSKNSAGNQSAIHRLRAAHEKVCKELEAEQELERTILDRLDQAEYDLAVAEVEKGKFILAEDDLLHREHQLSKEKTDMAMVRLHKEEHMARQALVTRRRDERTKRNVAIDTERKHIQAVEEAERSHERANRYLSRTLSKMKQRQQEEEDRYKSDMTRKMEMLLKLKQDIAHNRENLRAIRARDKAAETHEKSAEMEERSRILTEGGNAEEILLVKKRKNEMEKQKQQFDAEQKIKKANIMQKILQEEDNIKRRMQLQPYLWDTPAKEKALRVAPLPQKPLKTLENYMSATADDVMKEEAVTDNKEKDLLQANPSDKKYEVEGADDEKANLAENENEPDAGDENVNFADNNNEEVNEEEEDTVKETDNEVSLSKGKLVDDAQEEDESKYTDGEIASEAMLDDAEVTGDPELAEDVLAVERDMSLLTKPQDSDSSDAEEEEIQVDLAKPEFEGLWNEKTKAYKVTGADYMPVKPVGGSKAEQEILKNTLTKTREGIVITQVAAGREFSGCPFYSKPDVIHFKDFVVGKSYKKKVILTNVSYTVNYIKFLDITERLKDFIKIQFDPPGQMSAGLTCEMIVTFKPMINEDLKGTVNFLTQTGPFQIPLFCSTKKCDLTLDTTSIDFGTAVIGETLKRSFTLTNRGALGTKFDFFKVTGIKPRTLTTAGTSLGQMPDDSDMDLFSGDQPAKVADAGSVVSVKMEPVVETRPSTTGQPPGGESKLDITKVTASGTQVENKVDEEALPDNKPVGDDKPELDEKRASAASIASQVMQPTTDSMRASPESAEAAADKSKGAAGSSSLALDSKKKSEEALDKIPEAAETTAPASGENGGVEAEDGTDGTVGEAAPESSDNKQDKDSEEATSPDLAVSEMEDYGSLDGMRVGPLVTGEIGPFSSIHLEIVWQPTIPGKVDSEFLVSFSDPLSEPLSIHALANAIDVPVWVERQTVDLKICMFDRLYQDTVIVNNRATTALRLKFEVCKELRNHLELLPKTGYIQAQSQFSAQLKFLPRASLFEEASQYFDPETGVLEAPMTIRVADQVTPVDFTVQAVVTNSDLEFDVCNIDFGCCTVHESVRKVIKLTNKSILPQQYGFVGLPEYVEVQPNDGFGTLLPLETLELDVIFSPKKTKDYKFTLVCRSLINRDFKIPCKGTGALTPLELSHQVVHFSATPLYDISTATFNVINNHTSSNEFTHPVPRIGQGEICPVGPTSFEFLVPNDAPITVSPSVGTVKPGEKCRIQVRFSPALPDYDIRQEALRIYTKMEALREEKEREEAARRERLERESNAVIETQPPVKHKTKGVKKTASFKNDNNSATEDNINTSRYNFPTELNEESVNLKKSTDDVTSRKQKVMFESDTANRTNNRQSAAPTLSIKGRKHTRLKKSCATTSSDDSSESSFVLSCTSTCTESYKAVGPSRFRKWIYETLSKKEGSHGKGSNKIENKGTFYKGSNKKKGGGLRRKSGSCKPSQVLKKTIEEKVFPRPHPPENRNASKVEKCTQKKKKVKYLYVDQGYAYGRLTDATSQESTTVLESADDVTDVTLSEQTMTSTDDGNKQNSAKKKPPHKISGQSEMQTCTDPCRSRKFHDTALQAKNLNRSSKTSAECIKASEKTTSRVRDSSKSQYVKKDTFLYSQRKKSREHDHELGMQDTRSNKNNNGSSENELVTDTDKGNEKNLQLSSQKERTSSRPQKKDIQDALDQILNELDNYSGMPDGEGEDTDEEGQPGKGKNKGKSSPKATASKASKLSAAQSSSGSAVTEEKTPRFDPDKINRDSPEYLAAVTSLVRQFKGQFQSFSIPCHIASGQTSNPGELTYSIHNTLYLEVHCPAVRPPIVVISDGGRRTVDFGDISIGQTCPRSVTIQNISDQDLELKASVTNPSGPFLMLNALRSLAPGATHTLFFTFVPVRDQMFQEDLRIHTATSALHLTLKGRGVSPFVNVSVEDGVFDMSAVLVGEYVEKPFKMQNTSTLAIEYMIKQDSMSPLWHSKAQTIAPLLSLADSHKTKNYVGTQNDCGKTVFDIVPSTGTINAGETKEIMVTFAPDHESDLYSDGVRIELFDQEESHFFQLVGQAKPRVMFLEGTDPLLPSLESLAFQPLPADEDDSQGWPMSPPALVTVKSVMVGDTFQPGVREIYAGCVRTMAVSQKKNGEFSVEGLHGLLQKGFTVEPQKGMVEAGAKRPIVFTWTPPQGYDPSNTIEETVTLTLRCDITEQITLMIRAMVVSE